MAHAKIFGNPVLFWAVSVQARHLNLHMSPQTCNRTPPKPRGQSDLVLWQAQFCKNAEFPMEPMPS